MLLWIPLRSILRPETDRVKWLTASWTGCLAQRVPQPLITAVSGECRPVAQERSSRNSIGCLERAKEVFQVLAPYIVNVHLKDYMVFRPPHNKGFVVEGRPAGKGQLNIPTLLRNLRDSGRDSNVIVELWPPPQQTLAESMALEREWARQTCSSVFPLVVRWPMRLPLNRGGSQGPMFPNVNARPCPPADRGLEYVDRRERPADCGGVRMSRETRCAADVDTAEEFRALRLSYRGSSRRRAGQHRRFRRQDNCHALGPFACLKTRHMCLVCTLWGMLALGGGGTGSSVWLRHSRPTTRQSGHDGDGPGDC
jgi:hypothetical protein